MQQETNADVVVIGGGFAGLITANRLAELGRKPLVLEQGTDAAYLCNSRFTGGTFHVCFRDPVGRTPEELLEAIRTTSLVASEPLAQAVAHEVSKVIGWLREHGIRLAKAGAHEYKSWVLTPFRNNRYGLDWKGRGGDVALRTLTETLQAKGGLLKRGARAIALDLKDASQAVVEVSEGGQTHRYRANAVVIADGGFQGNPDLMRKFITPRPESLVQRGAGTGRGDGLSMALAAGAASIGMNRFYGHLLAKDALTNDNLWPFPVADPLVESAIVVNDAGERFADEGKGGVWMANQVAWMDDPLSAVIIFDDAIWRGPGADGLMSPNPNMVNAGANIASAGTIVELAGLVGLPADALARTVNAYNAALLAYKLLDLQPIRTAMFGKPMPIFKAPFHALTVAAGITYTMGGISIDEHARALDAVGKPVARLYAAGCCSGGLEGGPDSGGYVGGLAKSGVTALRAAEHIAANLT